MRLMVAPSCSSDGRRSRSVGSTDRWFTIRASTMNTPFVAHMRLANALALGGGPAGNHVSKPSAAILCVSVVTACPVVAPTGGVLAATQAQFLGACQRHMSAVMGAPPVAPRPRSAVRGVSGEAASRRLGLMHGRWAHIRVWVWVVPGADQRVAYRSVGPPRIAPVLCYGQRQLHDA